MAAMTMAKKAAVPAPRTAGAAALAALAAAPATTPPQAARDRVVVTCKSLILCSRCCFSASRSVFARSICRMASFNAKLASLSRWTSDDVGA